MRENKGKGREKIKGHGETTRHRCDQIYIRTVRLRDEPDAPHSLKLQKTEGWEA